MGLKRPRPARPEPPTGRFRWSPSQAGAIVDRRRVVRELWEVPVTELWFVDGSDHIGSRRVVEANAGVLERTVEGQARYWLAAGPNGA